DVGSAAGRGIGAGQIRGDGRSVVGRGERCRGAGAVLPTALRRRDYGPSPGASPGSVFGAAVPRSWPNLRGETRVRPGNCGAEGGGCAVGPRAVHHGGARADLRGGGP